jgi:hypothetical protein
MATWTGNESVLPLHRAEAWFIDQRWNVLCTVCGPIFHHDADCATMCWEADNADAPKCTNARAHAVRWAAKHTKING